MTWGFPAITAFVGLMGALERKLGADSGLQFNGVGVVCHRFEAQTHRGYTHSFHLSRNPVRKDGSTAGIVEEGRIHLDISLLFEVELSRNLLDETKRQQLAQTVATLRVAGGSVIAPHTARPRRALQPQLRLVAEDPEQQAKEFAKLSRRLLPGFALVARDDLLQKHQQALAEKSGLGQGLPVTALDAWLDLSRINTRAISASSGNATSGQGGWCPSRWVTPHCRPCTPQAAWSRRAMAPPRCALSKACIRWASGSARTACGTARSSSGGPPTTRPLACTAAAMPAGLKPSRAARLRWPPNLCQQCFLTPHLHKLIWRNTHGYCYFRSESRYRPRL